MILETILGLCLVQGILNNADNIENNFNRVGRIVMAAKRTRHIIHSPYCSCQNQVIVETKYVQAQPPRRELIAHIDFDPFQ